MQGLCIHHLHCTDAHCSFAGLVGPVPPVSCYKLAIHIKTTGNLAALEGEPWAWHFVYWAEVISSLCNGALRCAQLCVGKRHYFKKAGADKDLQNRIDVLH